MFGRLQAAEGGFGKVRGVSLFNYVMRRVWLQQTRIGLSLYDVTGQGYLTEHVSMVNNLIFIHCPFDIIHFEDLIIIIEVVKS